MGTNLGDVERAADDKLSHPEGCIMNDNDQPLNADAIYAAMVYLRDYSESEEGQADYRELLERKGTKANAIRSLGEVLGADTIHIRPKFDLSGTLKEEIYPGDPDSVDAGIELGRGIIWGPPGFASAMLVDADLTDPMMAALSRYVADRAN